MTRVKICGVTTPEDAALAVKAGAWAVGVIFAQESPRKLGLKDAARVMREVPDSVQKVGVFVNAAVEEIMESAEACGLTALQLHGEETPQFCAEVRRRTGLAVIKALRVSDEESLAGVVRFDTEMILLDTYQPGSRGGTGRPFDWTLAEAFPAEIRTGSIILSGGITPENAAEAVRRLSPFAIDVSSGVESSPGIKDPEKIKRLFEALNR